MLDCSAILLACRLFDVVCTHCSLTVNGASSNINLLERLQPSIMIVEEAAEYEPCDWCSASVKLASRMRDVIGVDVIGVDVIGVDVIGVAVIGIDVIGIDVIGVDVISDDVIAEFM